MAIEVNVGEQKTQEVKPFPKLMRSRYSEMIVLFYTSKKGTVVLGRGTNSINEVGSYAEDWAMGAFEDFNESVTIKNK